MAYPNSGTAYTQFVVQDSTQTTVASFYGTEHDWSNPVLSHNTPVSKLYPEGPFRLSNRDLPDDGYVMSKTHCGGYCYTGCSPRWFMLSTDEFLKECTTGAKLIEDKFGNSRIQVTHYDANIIQKIVHFFRDPLDNVISRFEHEFKLREINRTYVNWKSDYKKNVDGFREWCKDESSRLGDLRGNIDKDAIDKKTIESFESVPCHGEFYRYIKWHNNAFAVASKLTVPTFILHYRDFFDNFDVALNALLEFLELKPVAEKKKVSLQLVKKFYYSPAEEKNIAEFIHNIARPEIWQNLKRYFPGYNV